MKDRLATKRDQIGANRFPLAPCRTAAVDTNCDRHCSGSGTIRLKLLKIGVRIRVSVRAVRLSFDEGFPEAGLFGQVLARLQSLPLRC